jgi:hypothetical protein
MMTRGVAQMTLAGALRAAGDERAAVVAAHEARSLAAAKQDRAALRKIDAFLKSVGRGRSARDRAGGRSASAIRGRQEAVVGPRRVWV